MPGGSWRHCFPSQSLKAVVSKKKASKPKTLLQRRPYLMGSIAVLSIAAIALALYLAFGESDAEPRRQVRQDPVVTSERLVSVEVFDSDYAPRDLTVDAGATVTWEFTGDLPHNVTDDRGTFESPTLNKGEEWALTLDEPGTYYYYCTLHHVMQGTLTVMP